MEISAIDQIKRFQEFLDTNYYESLLDNVRKGSNFLIYPGGRLKLGEKEILGGSSIVHNLLCDCPDTKVVLVRITGFWGSMFSRALTGSVPDFGAMLLKGMKIVLKNPQNQTLGHPQNSLGLPRRQTGAFDHTDSFFSHHSRQNRLPRFL